MWDVMPGQLLVEECGGLIRHGDGEQVDCGGKRYLENTQGIIVVSPRKLGHTSEILASLDSLRKK